MQVFYHRLTRRLIYIYITAAILITACILFLNQRVDKVISENAQVGQLINNSGRQRTYSQNITKTILLLDHGVDSAEHAQLLKILIDDFTESHKQIEQSYPTYGLSAQTISNVDSLYRLIAPQYEGLVRNARAYPDQANAVSEVLAYEQTFLPIMDEIVDQFEVLSKELLQEIEMLNTIYDILLISIVIGMFAFVFVMTLSAVKVTSRELSQVQNELRSTLSKLKRKVEKLEFLTAAIKIGIWETCEQEGVENWSKRLYDILGYEVGEIPPTQEQFIALTHPADRAKLNRSIISSIRSGNASTVDVRVKHKSGEYKWLEVTGRVAKDENGKINLMMGGVTDIHQRKILENQLKTFVENAPAAIAMFDTEVNYLATSKEWVETYGLQDVLLTGQSHYDIFPEIGREWKEIHQKCLGGKVERNEEDGFIRSDGTLQWIKWEVRPWYISEEQVGGILMFTEDVTEQKLREDELRAMKETAEKASKAKEEFLATMSHEIRTPLNAIIGLSHILLNESPRPDQFENLNLLKFSGDNLLTLVNDILDLSKIDAGKLQLEEKPFDLSYVVSNIRQSLKFRAKENMVRITTYYDANLPSVFLGDVTRITQILYNLCGNAIKFTKNGDVILSVNMLSCQDEVCHLRISIKDQGIGISKTDQDRIFQSFEQADVGTTRQFGGTGLGLFITKKLLQMMGSDIHLRSDLGKGSEFFFDLKLNRGSVKLGINHLHSENPDFTDRNIKLLIAEDNNINRLIVQKFLTNTGVAFEFAHNGEEALQKVVAKDYDMILMDLQMPVMDGYTATMKIRAMDDPYFKLLPIIAVTSDAFADIKVKAINIGMDEHLSKPFKPSDLFHIIEKYSGLVSKGIN